MSKKHIYLVRVLPWQILLLSTLLISFFQLYPYTYYSYYWGDYVTYNYILWLWIFNVWEIFSLTFIFAIFHLLILIVSMVLYVIRSNEVNKFEGFPSIKDAIKYHKEKLKLEKLQKKYLEKEKINQAKILYIDKMQRIEEEKKKYL